MDKLFKIFFWNDPTITFLLLGSLVLVIIYYALTRKIISIRRSYERTILKNKLSRALELILVFGFFFLLPYFIYFKVPSNNNYSLVMFSKDTDYTMRYSYYNKDNNLITEKINGDSYMKISVAGELIETEVKSNYSKYDMSVPKLEIWENEKLIFEKTFAETSSTVNFRK